MFQCVRCDRSVSEAFRYCPWCGWEQEPKLTEFFHPHAQIERERRGALRVSRYLARAAPRRHVRFSVWSKSGEAEAAISIDEPEARRLAQFLLAETELAESPHESRLALLVERLRGSLLRTV
jgi:hypothetical protein